MSGPPNDGWEHGSGSIVASETGFAHAGPIVHNKRSNILVTHLDQFLTVTKLLTRKPTVRSNLRTVEEVSTFLEAISDRVEVSARFYK